MRYLMAEAASLGARRTYLEVRRSNLPAQRLYERLGFTVATVRRNYYSQPEEDALLHLDAHRSLPSSLAEPAAAGAGSLV